MTKNKWKELKNKWPGYELVTYETISPEWLISESDAGAFEIIDAETGETLKALPANSILQKIEDPPDGLGPSRLIVRRHPSVADAPFPLPRF